VLISNDEKTIKIVPPRDIHIYIYIYVCVCVFYVLSSRVHVRMTILRRNFPVKVSPSKIETEDAKILALMRESGEQWAAVFAGDIKTV